MADYGGVGGGQSLRDALNRIMPMTGMGEWGAMFPPPTGADQPTAPVPIPQPQAADATAGDGRAAAAGLTAAGQCRRSRPCRPGLACRHSAVRRAAWPPPAITRRDRYTQRLGRGELTAVVNALTGHGSSSAASLPVISCCCGAACRSSSSLFSLDVSNLSISVAARLNFFRPACLGVADALQLCPCCFWSCSYRLLLCSVHTSIFGFADFAFAKVLLDFCGYAQRMSRSYV